MNDGASFVVPFFSRDPHRFKSTERSKNGATDPGAELAFRGRENFDFDIGRGQRTDFVEKAVAKIFKVGGAAGENNVRVKGLAEVMIGTIDGVD